MRKLLAFIKNDFRLVTKQWYIYLFMFVILPIFFMTIMNFSMGEVKEASSTKIDMNISLVNKDQGEIGKLLDKTLHEKPINKYITIKEGEDITVIVPEGFTENINNKSLIISTKGNFSNTDVNILRTFLTNWHQSILEQKTLHETLNDQSDEVKKEVMQSLIMKNQTLTENLFQRKSLNTDKLISSKVYYLVSALIYSFLISMTMTTGFALKDELKGVYKRLEVMPLSLFQKKIFDWISATLLVTITSIFIMVIAKYLLKVDLINEWRILPWIIIFAGLFNSLGALLLSTFSKTFIQIMSQLIIMFFVFTGFIPLGSLLGGTAEKILSNNIFEKYMINPMCSVLTGEWPSNTEIILAITCIVIIINLGLSMFISSRRERF